MPFYPILYGATPIASFRPPISLRRSNTQLPTRRRPILAPKVLPILQPPQITRQSDFLYEKEERKQDEVYNYLTTTRQDHGRKVTRQLSIRIPKFTPQQNYPKQPLSHFFTYRNRRAEPKRSLRVILER